MEELEDNKILYKQKIFCIQKQEVPSHLNNNNVLDAIASCYIDLDLFTELNYE